MRRYIVIGYLVALSVTIGLVLTLGILVAPVVFNTQTLITDTLSHFSQGVVMTEIFVRANYWLIMMMSMVVIYEAYDYKMGRKDPYVFVSSLVVVFTIGLFAFYYTPLILEMQAARDTTSDVFKNIHTMSELSYKLLLVGLVVLVLRRFTQLVRAK